MIIQPKIRGFICTTAHPKGCAMHVQQQIDYVKSQPPVKNGPKRVLVIGSSTGFGLSSRVVATFGGSEAKTIGVFFERASEGNKTATAGWYNMAAFEQKAHAAGYYAKSFNGDAFSDEMKKQVIETIKKDWGGVDLVIYSLASPRRKDPKSEAIYKSTLKPIVGSYTNKSIDLSKHELEEVTLNPASQEEIDHTVKVMGGEDWEMWIDALDKEGLLAEGVMTVAYSYIGPQLTHSIYRQGTIGRAKDHLEATAKKLDERFKKHQGRALVSVNKALVTQSSSAIPFIPLYFVFLKKVMKAKNTDEGCVEQIYRLFAQRLFMNGEIPVDEEGRVRVDDLELEADVQAEVMRCWEAAKPETLKDLADLSGYNDDFLKLFGFGLKGVNYEEDLDPAVGIESIG